MNVKRLLPATVVLYLAVGATATAGRQPNEPNASQENRQSGSPQLRTFSGTVWQNGGKFVLRDKSHKVWYSLDDQRWAARFEGKEVRVTGTLDAANNAIHVQNIEEDPVHSG